MIETSYRQLLRKKKTHHITTKHEHKLKRKQQKPLGFQTPPKNVFGPQQHTIQTPTPGDMTGRLGKVSVNPAAVEKETTKKMVGPHHVSRHCLLSFPLSFPDRRNPQMLWTAQDRAERHGEIKVTRERRLSFWGKLQCFYVFLFLCLKKVSSHLFSVYIHYHQRVKYTSAIIFMYFLYLVMEVFWKPLVWFEERMNH